MMMVDPTLFLKDFVAIPSLSGEETAVAHYLVSHMTALGMDAHIDGVGNAVGVRECPDADGRLTHDIVLLGHMDTVPGNIPVRIENGRLYGRGSVDAKGPLAVFVLAAARAVLPPGRRVVVIGAVEEETATSKGARHVVTCYQPDWCIIGEPSGSDGVTLGYKGRLLVDYTHGQPMSHTAGPGGGVAEMGIAWVNQVMAAIDQFNQGRSRLFDRLLPAIRHIHTSSDGLANGIEIKLGIRLPPDFDAAVFEEQVRAWAGAARVHFYGYEAAFCNGRTTSLAQTFNRVLRQNGVQPRFKHKTGTSDMNVVGPAWRCPMVAYGPGDSRLDHTPEEHLVIDEYLQAIEVLKSVVEMGNIP